MKFAKFFFVLLVAWLLSSLSYGEGPSYTLISSKERNFAKSLDSFLSELETALEGVENPYVAVDTEFFTPRGSREPILSLIQIAGPKGLLAVIDVRNSRGSELLPLYLLETLGERIFLKKEITKVFHAGTKDLMLLRDLFKARDIPNCVDTQVLCAFCLSDFFVEGEVSHPVGYSGLVARFLSGVILDKTLQTSRWDVRPLIKEQLDYAAADVQHLYEIYPLLSARVVQLGPSFSRCAFLASKETLREVFHDFRKVVGKLSEEEQARFADLKLLLNKMFQSLGMGRTTFLSNEELKFFIVESKSWGDLEGWRRSFYLSFLSQIES